MKKITNTFMLGSLGLILSSIQVQAIDTPECLAGSAIEWMTCKSKIEGRTIKNVQVTNDFVCSENDNCSLEIHGNSNVKIWSNNSSMISRTGRFSKPIISIVNSDTVEIKNIKLSESINIPIQPTPGAQELNKVCINTSCASPLSVYQSKNIVIDGLTIDHGKVFGIQLAKNKNVKILNSTIKNAWWFGVWGSENHGLTFYKNQFISNRSNGILMGNSLTDETKVVENYFSGNHHATAFHTCGRLGNEPCPGGQIDLVDPVSNVLVEGNVFENSKMSGEFPEDSKYNWISAVEFEAAKSGISSVYIRNNVMRNNSGSPFYINLPSPDIKDTFTVDLEVSGNTFCNNRTKDFHAPNVPWANGIRLFDNNLSCDSPPAQIGEITTTNCTISAPTQQCQASVSWSAPNHNSACVFAGDTLWACEGKAATKTLGFASLRPIDLILRAGNKTTGQELARVKLQATLQETPKEPIIPIVNKKGLGCSDLNCIYLVGPNLSKGMYVDLRDKSNSSMIAGNIQTNYVKNNDSEHVLTFVIPESARTIFKKKGFNLYVVDPVNATWSSPLFYKRP